MTYVDVYSDVYGDGGPTPVSGRPVFSATTERVYASLPEVYRNEDELRNWPLLRYLACFVDYAGDVEALYDRFNYVAPSDGGPEVGTSELVDPSFADFAWLRWLGQLIGVDVPATLTENEARDAVQFASSGWRAGTKTGIADAAKSALTGSKHVSVEDHHLGDAWTVRLVTRTSETPDVDAVLQAVVDKKAKPAGVVLAHTAYSASWAQIEATYPTWTDVGFGAVNWQTLEEAGLT